jgi:hypothetical protein
MISLYVSRDRYTFCVKTLAQKNMRTCESCGANSTVVTFCAFITLVAVTAAQTPSFTWFRNPPTGQGPTGRYLHGGAFKPNADGIGGIYTVYGGNTDLVGVGQDLNDICMQTVCYAHLSHVPVAVFQTTILFSSTVFGTGNYDLLNGQWAVAPVVGDPLQPKRIGMRTFPSSFLVYCFCICRSQDTFLLV